MTNNQFKFHRLQSFFLNFKSYLSFINIFFSSFHLRYFSDVLKNDALVKIDKHICDLLNDNECVIVPKMGGFLSSHSRAGIHSLQYSSAPFSKKLSFNVLLNYNDGLLANHIVQHEKLAYNEALKEIEKFVDEFNQELGSGKKFIVEQVGILYKDAGRNVQFEPFKNLNYSSDSAGISDLKSLSVSHNEFNCEAEKQPETPVTSCPSKPHQRKFIAIKRSEVIVFALLLTGSILTFCLYVYFSSPSKLNSTTLNSHALKATEQPVYKNASKSESGVPVPPSDVAPEIVNGGSPNPVTKKGVMLPNPSTALVDAAANMSENKYFIIAGSFRSFDNAKRKLDELKLQGFKNAQILSDSRHLQLVCYDRFNTFEEAHEKMNSIEMQFKEAWIYSR